MSKVILKDMNKCYENNFKAVRDINLEIEDGEFVVLVGPSGCGKSTTLRMIAGLEEISSGELFIGDKLVNKVEPVDRDIAMVFQNYALYPHFSVYENMAFALKIKKIPKAEIKSRILEAAKILELEELLDRKPKELSGGQRQRVALGRAMVREPKVFLMDEPLSNLDAKLRVSMRSEIIKLHEKLETTFIYVTHDQTEAMTMGSKIVVMNKGEIMQAADPITIYRKPANKFVASFIGSPQMNFMKLNVCSENNKLYIRNDFINYEVKNEDLKFTLEKDYEGCRVEAGIRPENIEIVDSFDILSDLNARNLTLINNDFKETEKHKSEYIAEGIVELIEILGAETYVHFKIQNNKFICKVNGIFDGTRGQKIKVKFNFAEAHFFDIVTELRIDYEKIANEKRLNKYIKEEGSNKVLEAVSK